MASILHPRAKRALLVALIWAVARLLCAVDGSAWGAEQTPTTLSNPENQNAMLNAGLIEGLTAYTSGDYAKALDCFQRAGQNLKGDAAQELQVKIALCHLLLNHAEQGRTLLETLRAESAGGLGGLQADQILQRLDAAQPASPADREAVLRAEYLLSVGAAEDARKAYNALMGSGANDATREFARAQALVLEATDQIMLRKFDEVPALVQKNFTEFRSPYNAWHAVLTIADVANSHISGDNVDDIFSRIDAVERFVQEWSTRGFPDGSTAAQYHQVLGNLGLHRLIYAVHPENGIDSGPLIEATRAQLEEALELARKSSLPLQGAIMADLVDIYLMASDYREAAKLAQALYDEFPSCPLVPGVWLKIGMVHKNLSNIERSIEWLSKVLVQFPGSYAALQAQALLGDQLLDYTPVSEKAATEEIPGSPADPNLAAEKKGRDDSSVSASSGAAGGEGRKDVSASASSGAAGQEGLSPSSGADGPPGAEEHGHLAKGSGLVSHRATWTAWMALTAILLTCLAAALYRRWVRVKPLKGGDDVA